MLSRQLLVVPYAWDMDDRVLITVSEAARRLDTYPNAINRWIARGELEAFRVEERGFRFVDAGAG